jgi:transposase-like protein
MSEGDDDPKDVSTINRKSGRAGQVEVISGRERRRAWTAEQKLQIVAESFEAGAPLTHVPVVEGRRVVGIVPYTDFRGMEHARLEDETEFFETIR